MSTMTETKNKVGRPRGKGKGSSNTISDVKLMQMMLDPEKYPSRQALADATGLSLITIGTRISRFLEISPSLRCANLDHLIRSQRFESEDQILKCLLQFTGQTQEEWEDQVEKNTY
jgi:hypothetical protein